MPLDSHENTEELVQRSRRGDGDASRRLVESHYGQVVAIVRKNCPRTSEPEDMAQEVFMKMFSRMEQYRGGQPFSHWLARIAVNTCYDHLRKQKVRPLFTYTDLNLEEATCLERTVARNPEPGAALDGAAIRSLVEKLLATLKPAEQIAVRLLDLEELSVREACDLTGWGASKVKVSAMRGRKKLRRKLEHLREEVA